MSFGETDMTLDIGGIGLQLNELQLLAAFWTAAVLLAFNIAYVLCLADRKGRVSSARKTMVMLMGSLVVTATYADALAAKPFALRDCMMLAFVFAHGWTAEEMVQGFIAAAAKKFHGGPPQPPMAPAGEA